MHFGILRPRWGDPLIPLEFRQDLSIDSMGVHGLSYDVVCLVLCFSLW